MNVPGINKGPNATAASPRMVVMDSRRRVLPRKMNYLLPITLLFAVAGIAYTFKWNSDRQKNGGGVCVDCVRQREMVEEVYFNKKPLTQKGSRL
ncbi:unspecified product [Leishmania tarentolae]|uniref:Unspecified product n=1 Tax=Leishmania tarentolae TaxID=5689 RepID=A0A640KXP3_LEITA|nr:unspecified product [Leishmania tarentolae]